MTQIGWTALAEKSLVPLLTSPLVALVLVFLTGRPMSWVVSLPAAAAVAAATRLILAAVR